jgi:hypothetical protein
VKIVRGTIGKIWHNHRTDGSEFWVLSIDGERYSTWDGNLIANIQEGDLVEFTFNKSGRYQNLLAINRLSRSPFLTADMLTTSPESLRMVRMNCLRTSAELLKDTTMLPEQKTSMTIAMAKKLEEHILARPIEIANPKTKDPETDHMNQQEGKA